MGKHSWRDYEVIGGFTVIKRIKCTSENCSGKLKVWKHIVEGFQMDFNEQRSPENCYKHWCW